MRSSFQTIKALAQLRGPRKAAFLEPRGLMVLVGKLKAISSRYSVTAWLAAAEVAPIVPSRLGASKATTLAT